MKSIESMKPFVDIPPKAFLKVRKWRQNVNLRQNSVWHTLLGTLPFVDRLSCGPTISPTLAKGPLSKGIKVTEAKSLSD